MYDGRRSDLAFLVSWLDDMRRGEEQLYNVFYVQGERIASVRDFALRAEALEAAGAHAPGWV